MANSQKLENLLNLALDVSKAEREQSMVLGEGYLPARQVWEIIVKYNGTLSRLRSATVKIEELIAGYAIVTLPEAMIDSFIEMEEVEYVEKPKRLYFDVLGGKQSSCILQISQREPYLNGNKVIIAVLDSGIDYESMAFRHADGTSRILYLWDQTLDQSITGGAAPAGFDTGVEFSKSQIDAALLQTGQEERFLLVPSRDVSGHGTAVATIAAGSSIPGREVYTGVAPDSDLIIVKLGNPRAEGFPRTTELMRAVTYTVRKAVSLGMPVAINISIGNTYGSHDGTSLLERFLDNAAEIGRSVICVGSGNEGAAAGHTAGVLANDGRIKNIEFGVADYQKTINLQLWKDYADDFRMRLLSPGGESVSIDNRQPGTQTILMENTKILLYVGEPSPYSVKQELYFDFLPVSTYINRGVWSLRFEPIRIVSGNYDLYLPSSVVLNAGTNFFTPSPEKTLTIPSTSSKVITVGAYDTTFDAYADFSGRGYLLENVRENRINTGSTKPDLVAPGVNISTLGPGGTVIEASGTSFATPFVTGAAALLMEWGIIRGNDRYLYGEKVKAYLIKGARQLPGMETPNAMTGWGALCVKDALPV